MIFQQRFHLYHARIRMNHDAGTIAPARSLGTERDIGSFEIGKLADLVMLGGRLYDAATMNEVETGEAQRLPYWWE